MDDVLDDLDADVQAALYEAEMLEHGDSNLRGEVDEAQSDALYGRDGNGGCQGDGYAAFPFAYFAPYQRDLGHDASERAESSEAYTDAIAEYSRCIATEGFPGVKRGNLRQEIKDQPDAIIDAARGVAYPGIPIDHDRLYQLRDLRDCFCHGSRYLLARNC